MAGKEHKYDVMILLSKNIKNIVEVAGKELKYDVMILLLWKPVPILTCYLRNNAINEKL